MPIKGKLFCMRHGGGQDIKRHPLKKPPTALAEHAREMRRQWRADPWAAGYTVELDLHGQQRVEAWSGSAGIHWDWLSPRVQDFARWAFLNFCRSGRHPDDDAYASDNLAERIRAQIQRDGRGTVGHHVDRSGASRVFARFRVVPQLGEAAQGWTPSRNGKPRRVLQAAALELARDRALAASEPQNRKEAVERLLAMERLAAREQQAEAARRAERAGRGGGGELVERDGW